MTIMKKYIRLTAIALLTLASTNMWAQGMWDAYRYSQQFNEGTARSAAMGNASVALGGDIGSISINPATSGVFRYHEFVFTPAITTASSKVEYLGTTTNESKTRFGVPNFGYIASFETGRRTNGLINWNIGLAFNKVNNFTSRMSATGITAQSSWLASLAQSTNGINSFELNMNDSNDPFYNSTASWKSILGWNTSLLDNLDSPEYYKGATENINDLTNEIYIGGDLDQYYAKETIGNVSEAVINFGGNISNKLFFGFNIGIQSIWYKHSELYSEMAVNSRDFQSGFSSFTHYYNYSTSGTGINLKAGIIYLPVQGLRLGASISTPTWMYLHEEWDESMSAHLKATAEHPNDYVQDLRSPLGIYDYRLNTPFRWNIGAAYTFKQIAAISIDYESVNYGKMKLIDPDYQQAFHYQNIDIANNFGKADILRAGLEVKFNPQVAFRAGYQYYTSGYNNDNSTIQIGSLGLGYASPNGFFADIAYQQYLKKAEETFTLYDDILENDMPVAGLEAPVGVNRYNMGKLLISIGFRF